MSHQITLAKHSVENKLQNNHKNNHHKNRIIIINFHFITFYPSNNQYNAIYNNIKNNVIQKTIRKQNTFKKNEIHDDIMVVLIIF